MKKILFVIFLLTGLSCSFAQETSFDKVKKLFEAFDYNNVIKSSEELLQKGNLSDSLTIEVHLMRAIAFYSNGDELSTRKSFENILKIKKNFTPDPSRIPPKLIQIFGEVKTEYMRNNPDIEAPRDTTQAKQEIKHEDLGAMRSATITNLLLPGAGQFQIGNTSKGWIVSSAAALNLGAMIYFIIDTKKKENNYLNESDRTLMAQKYDDYNKTYKVRNVLIATYAAIWIYSQIDLLFLDGQNSAINESQKLSLTLENYSAISTINLGFRFKF